MGKKVENTDNFTGGQNSDSSSIKIAKFEASKLRKLIVSDRGILKAGASPSENTDISAVAVTHDPLPGEGLGAYQTDFDVLSATDTIDPAPSETPRQIITLQDGLNLRLYQYDASNPYWHAKGVDLMTGEASATSSDNLYGGDTTVDQYAVDGDLRANNSNFAQYMRSHTEEEGWGPPWGRQFWHTYVQQNATPSVPQIVDLWIQAGTLSETATGYDYVAKYGFTAWLEDAYNDGSAFEDSLTKERWEVHSEIRVDDTEVQSSERVSNDLHNKINGKSFMFTSSVVTVSGYERLRLTGRTNNRHFVVQLTTLHPIISIVDYYATTPGKILINLGDYDGMEGDWQHSIVVNRLSGFNILGLCDASIRTDPQAWEGSYFCDTAQTADDDVIVSHEISGSGGFAEDKVSSPSGRPMAYLSPFTSTIPNYNLITSDTDGAGSDGWSFVQQGAGTYGTRGSEGGYMQLAVTDATQAAIGTYEGWKSEEFQITSGKTYSLTVTAQLSTPGITLYVSILTGDFAAAVGGVGFPISFTGGGAGSEVVSHIKYFIASETALCRVYIWESTGANTWLWQMKKMNLSDVGLLCGPDGIYGVESPLTSLSFVPANFDGYEQTYFNTGTRIQLNTMRRKLAYKKATYFKDSKIYDGSVVSGPFPVEIDEYLTGFDSLLSAPDVVHGMWASISVLSVLNAIGCASNGSQMDVSEVLDVGQIYFSSVSNSTGGSLSGRYYFGMSYYDEDGQHTEVSSLESADYNDVDEGGYFSVNFAFKPFGRHATASDYNTYGFDKRVEGAIWWMRKAGNWEWRRVLELDFVKGYRYSGWDEYKYYTDYSANLDQRYNSLLFGLNSFEVKELPTASYKDVTGYHAKDNKRWRWKASCIGKNRAYIGNVAELSNDFSESSSNINKIGVVYPDRMIVSENKQFDIFPEGNIVDICTEDGDAIVALAALGEQVLQFKRKSMYILNVSDAGVFVENEFKFYGVDSKAAVVNTANGVAWCNESGVYHYDGQTIEDITLDKVNELWISRYNKSDVPMLGYSSSNDILLAFPKGANGAPQTETDINLCESTSGWTTTLGDEIDLISSSPSPQQGTYSLRYTKDSSYSIVRMYRTVDLDLEDTVVSFWYYVAQLTIDKMNPDAALGLRIGSDVSNYYEYWIARSHLTASVWTKASFHTSFPDGTAGTPPALSDITYFAISMDADYPSSWHNWDGVAAWHFDNITYGNKSHSGDLMIYEFYSGAWTDYGGPHEDLGHQALVQSFTHGARKTNMVNATFGDENVSLIKEDTTGSDKFYDFNYIPSNFYQGRYVSRFSDFGASNLQKKVYKVHITLRSGQGHDGTDNLNHTGMQIQYYTDDGGEHGVGTAYNFTVVQGGVLSGSIALLGDYSGLAGSSVTKWYTVILKPATSSEANNIRNFQIAIENFKYDDVSHGDDYRVPSTFEINDIQVLYKLKGVA